LRLQVVSLPKSLVPKWTAWSPADAKPKLHTLTVYIMPSSTEADLAAAPVDRYDLRAIFGDFQGFSAQCWAHLRCRSIEVRFGLRIVKAAGRHITINGSPIKLHGYNRHVCNAHKHKQHLLLVVPRPFF